MTVDREHHLTLAPEKHTPAHDPEDPAHDPGPDPARDGEPARTTEWERLLARVRADALDCLQSNVAVLADRCHGPGSHLALGATWGWCAGADDTVERPPEERVAEAARAVDLRVAARWHTTDGAFLRGLARAHGPLHVVGDAHLMPWLPYAGHAHMPHSFLLCPGPDDATTTIVDAYHNDTPWGPARPGTWTLPAARTAALFDDGVTARLLEPATPPAAPPDPGRVLADNAARLTAAAPDRERYLAGVGRRTATGDADAVHRLVLDVWLLLRERALHAAWLRHVGLPAEAVGPMTDLVDAWRALATHSYVARRRHERSGRWDASVTDRMAALLRREPDVAHQLARARAPERQPAHDGARTARTAQQRARDEAVAAIRRALMAALSVDADVLDRAPSLTELPGFDSYRLVEVLDSVEHDLGRPYDPAGLSARAVRDADSLAELFTTAAPTAGSGVPS